MLFNSIEFAYFLPIVFLIYWFIANKKLAVQNIFILLASYFFYGWWDWRFLSLIFFSSCIDYFIGLKLGEDVEEKRLKLLLFCSVIVNIGLLCVFKYYNFFADNFVQAFSLLGVQFDITRLNVILPIGISFYTFQTLSYSIDIYRGKLEPTKDFISFAAFVSFFPQLVAGPIERATNLLPQFYEKRTFEYNKAVDGMRQILWGLFKKIVIADNCAIYADLIFNNSADYPGSSLLLGVFFFAFQIYGDFSGYSDIAIGTARLFGFNLTQNFATPYLSKSITEFWRRWHISLGSWINDYLFLPLSMGFVRKWGRYGVAMGTLLSFAIIGLWHGANWTFIFFGLLHGFFLGGEFLLQAQREQFSIRIGKKLHDFLGWCYVIIVVMVGMVLFRAENITHAFSYMADIFKPDLFTMPYIIEDNEMSLIKILPKVTPLIILFCMLLEWTQKEQQYALEKFGLSWKSPIRWLFYAAIVISIHISFYGNQAQEFIYFQF